MHLDIQIAIAGAASGALFALVATGLMIQFRSSGILNLGLGAVATVSSYLFLYASGSWGWSMPVSIVVSILVGMGICGLFQFLVVRPLRNSPTVAKIAATIGLMLTLTAVVVLWFGPLTPPSATLFGEDPESLHFGHPAFIVASNRIWFVIITVVITVALWAIYRFTRFGRATRAAADNQRAAEGLGYSAQRLELVNWVIGGGLAAVAGICLGTISPPSSTSITGVLLVAIAIALLAKFQSFGIMLVAGIVVGALQALATFKSANLQSATHLTGWSDALPLIVIVGAVLIGGRGIAAKGARIEPPFPDAPVVRHPFIGTGAVAVIAVGWILLVPSWLVDPTTVSIISFIWALSVVVVTGYAGQISLAQLSFAGLGAFIAAKSAVVWHLPFPVPVLVGGLVAMVIALAVGAPSLRVRGLNLAVITLGIAMVADVMFFADVSVTGGQNGIPIPAAKFLGINLNDLTHARSYSIAALVIAVLLGFGVAMLRKTSVATRMLAIRSNERGAAASGISAARTKLIAFMIGGFIAGAGGAMEAYRELQINWTNFSFTFSLLLVGYAYLGGITSISGAIAAGILLSGGIVTAIFNFQGNAEQIVGVIGGVGVILIVLFHPEGIGALPRQLVGALARLRHRPDDPTSTKELPVELGVAESLSPSSARGTATVDVAST